ncbi:MAG: MFS transporter [Kineosporiaceae bacterium]
MSAGAVGPADEVGRSGDDSRDDGPDDISGDTSGDGPGSRGGLRGILRGGARTAVRTTVRTTRATGRGARAVWRGGRRWTHAEGAGESGLARMSELGFVSTAGDTLIVTALAGTLFFSVSATAARERVATSLLVTMVPFVLLAPVIGPVLDRVRSGRRYAMATTMLARAFLAWVMADVVTGGSTPFWLYLEAFGFLLFQKAYLVTRSAAVPRVLPPGTTLVTANSRISLAGVVSMTVAAPIGAAIAHEVGPSWTLRLAFVIFAAATVLAVALPEQVDSSAGEERARLTAGLPAATSAAGPPPRDPRPRLTSIGPRGVLTLRAGAATRWLAGFLTLFLAFRLRTDPLPGLSETASVGLVVAVAAVGSGVGSALGAVVRRARPEVIAVSLLTGTALVALWSAVSYGLVSVPLVALAAGIAASLSKLGLDAVIQSDVAERVRTSAFARSETVLQLAWVAGGVVGLFLPLSGPWGLGFATLVTAGAALLAAVDLSRLPPPGTRTRRRPATS